MQSSTTFLVFHLQYHMNSAHNGFASHSFHSTYLYSLFCSCSVFALQSRTELQLQSVNQTVFINRLSHSSSIKYVILGCHFGLRQVVSSILKKMSSHFLD